MVKAPLVILENHKNQSLPISVVLVVGYEYKFLCIIIVQTINGGSVLWIDISKRDYLSRTGGIGHLQSAVSQGHHYRPNQRD